ncbi:hypothetical protein FE36_05150 [Xanthomonas oryzae pv. oryzicola]|uniref:Uncharacterized protein n=1 Tax=Xanthomonas oryzae pv. oryzicola (strain BLS256) TaxID=383407 RepID=G7TH72_XANOB|nr:hypothetical protein XOC_1272 [Xanthomonas oryzae pv. oryzicola BLS256]AKK63271.1 hypothetical protein FE36_05150 [Xanthomonas oryzae pv. oryzicola]PUE94461.1 hypothetical protein C7T79_11465 [Xanthomonas oryzae pv. oryzicola]QEO98649.1 hypothetical protein XOCgx_3660 [Xanthomonas oryzae pv. oryzicola]
MPHGARCQAGRTRWLRPSKGGVIASPPPPALACAANHLQARRRMQSLAQTTAQLGEMPSG